ncbi:MAG: Nif3-like dinuclear metal center hexameric protein [Planctomycetaceae bacterium]
MTTVKHMCGFLDSFAPTALAEDWDNVGLLLGDEASELKKVLTCLTLTQDVAEEAVSSGVQLIVSHHPILFRKVQRITNHTPEGRMILTLLANGIAVYSPHTGYDSAACGINQQLAESLQLKNIQPIRELDDDPRSGSGRFGDLDAKMSLPEFLEFVKNQLSLDKLQFVSGNDRAIKRVAIACGSAAEFLGDATKKSCDVLVTGEARFHALLEARTMATPMILLGHFASERPAMEHMAKIIGDEFPNLKVTASQAETDPLEWA